MTFHNPKIDNSISNTNPINLSYDLEAKRKSLDKVSKYVKNKELPIRGEKTAKNEDTSVKSSNKYEYKRKSTLK